MSPQEKIDEIGITVKADFIPFSQSRNKDAEHMSLNWRITTLVRGNPVLITDYTAGMAHCPSYKQNAGNTLDYASRIKHECETGTKARVFGGMEHVAKGAKINPDTCDVLYSLVMDSNVLDYASFEDWADCYGYDQDSRSAESIYRACLDIALKLRAALGDENMRTLQEAFEDY